ncbi:hypothetical protein Metfor_1499 [Methanoregula formicica SMSP]|uniref:Uncharacterized protein n=1 Tax=Methanoregula formicica (strain DSM 22288 / NBRC 105244 / SMSP) TaxID=593750 RepID=L0HCR9_METFS|nr:hypothetical protein Metfor_1499 [Methanoregula formicica SMSP]
MWVPGQEIFNRNLQFPHDSLEIPVIQGVKFETFRSLDPYRIYPINGQKEVRFFISDFPITLGPTNSS